MRVCSWNINSVRLRINLVEKLVREFDPDVLCLQETKCSNGEFPLAKMKALGLIHCVYEGMRAYNGVAICSKRPLADKQIYNWCGQKDARHIAATHEETGIEVHCLYVPSGGDVPDTATNKKFVHKLQFLKDQAKWWAEHRRPDQKVIITGDLNVAPLENDVWSHKQMLDVISHTPVEVEHLSAWQQTLGFVDSHRQITPPDEKLYSWWSYRAKDWQTSNRGRRLDHLWLTPGLAPQLKGAFVHPDARGWLPKPSDHVPIFADLAPR